MQCPDAAVPLRLVRVVTGNLVCPPPCLLLPAPPAGCWAEEGKHVLLSDAAPHCAVVVIQVLKYQHRETL